MPYFWPESVSWQRSVAPWTPFRLSGHVTESGLRPTCWVSLLVRMLATWFLSTVSTMSNLTSLPLTLVTVTLTLKVWSLTFIVQLSCAPTLATRSSGHVTESGLFPLASVSFDVIWLATSLLLTVDFEVTEHEQAPAVVISPAAAPAIRKVRTIERAIAPPEGESTTENR